MIKSGHEIQKGTVNGSELDLWKGKKEIDSSFDAAIGAAKDVISVNLLGCGSPTSHDSKDTKVSCSIDIFLKAKEESERTTLKI